MKRVLWILGISAMVLGQVACDRNSLTLSMQGEDGDNIVVNPNKQWTKSKLPAYIGDISAYPQHLQTVIRGRFTKEVGLDAAGIIFAGASDMATDADKLSAAAANGAFVVVPPSVDLSLLGADPLLAPDANDALPPLFYCYSGWGRGEFYVMYNEAEMFFAEEGEPSMTEEEWKALSLKNQGLGDDGGSSMTDYDNDSSHNENYFQARMDPFVDWVDAAYVQRHSFHAPLVSSYDELRENIEQSGQRLSFNYPFSINAYIDKATWSDPDYLNKSGSISVEFYVYPIYMQSSNGSSKAGDYYGVVSTVTPHNQSMWGPYVGAHGACRNRIYGFWFNDMDVETYLMDANGNDIPGLEYFERPIPENKNDSKTYSNGKTFSMSGGISGGASGGHAYVVGNFSLGGTWTSSTNYTLETISYSRNSSNATVKYHYWSENVKLTDDWDDWTLINQNFPAPVRNEFSAHTMWVWHVPSSVVSDGDTKTFRMGTEIQIHYSTWYHWRASAEFDSNKKDHLVRIPVRAWNLDRPDRTPWGFIRLRNAANNEMAHVSFYKKGEESGDPVATLTTSYGKGEEARIALPEGTYSVTWDAVDGDTGARLSSWIYRNVKVHQGANEETATVRISSVDGEKVE